MRLNAITNRIPGASRYTPNDQLHVQQSPRVGGLSAADDGILKTTEDFISVHPLVVLAIIGLLMLR